MIDLLTRRTLLSNAGRGVGALALSSLLSPGLLSKALASQEKSGGILPGFHNPPKAKRVIWLTMAGEIYAGT